MPGWERQGIEVFYQRATLGDGWLSVLEVTDASDFPEIGKTLYHFEHRVVVFPNANNIDDSVRESQRLLWKRGGVRPDHDDRSPALFFANTGTVDVRVNGRRCGIQDNKIRGFGFDESSQVVLFPVHGREIEESGFDTGVFQNRGSVRQPVRGTQHSASGSGCPALGPVESLYVWFI